MEQKETPLYIEGISTSIYGGFWSRVGAAILDTLIYMPVIVLVQYLNSLGKQVFFYTCIPSFLLSLWFYIYLTKQYGGTPGKLIVGLKIIKLNGDPVGWREAILRHLILAILGVMSIFVMIYALNKADAETLASYNWFQQSQYLGLLAPTAFAAYSWATNIWTLSEFVVLLTNKRRRAVHDFIAGTVIIKKQYLYDISRSLDDTIASIGTKEA